MPLTEISSNIPNHAAISRSVSAVNGIDKSFGTASDASRAVQSMLKTGTELGDLGQFAQKPPRIPRSESRIRAIQRR